MDYDTIRMGLPSSSNSDGEGDGCGIVGKIPALQSNGESKPLNDAIRTDLLSSSNCRGEENNESGIAGAIPAFQSIEACGRKNAFAQRAIADRAIVPAVLQPVGSRFPDDIKMMEACMHEMISKSADKGGSIGIFPSQTQQLFPSTPAFGLPHTAVASRVSSMFPMYPTLHNHEFASNIVSLPAPFVQGFAAPSTDVDVNEKKVKEIKKGAALAISLVPENRTLLSDYNYILAQNIEFFETPASYKVPASLLENMKELPTKKIGLRCIHCSSNGFHITAASFFPSAVASLSSGMGTIGSRHFIGGKCTFIPTEVVAALVSSKSLTQQQKKTRLGLDAYCKQIAKANKMKDHEIGGIFISSQGGPEDDDIGSTSKQASQNKTGDKPGPDDTSNSKIIATVIKKASPPKDHIPNRKDPSAFVEGSVEHFWECKYCNSLPFHWRPTGSVIFCAEKPKIELVGRHLSVCQGKKPLTIPRNASIKIRNAGDLLHGPSVLVQWSNDESKRKSSRTKRQSLGPGENAKKKRKISVSVPIEDIKRGVDDELLAVPEDKALTTDFAFFTVLQLKKCYLTKSGGSRGNCPPGYPGLACSHCAGSSNERRFFYTSADHLRNSFSHIPSHILSCIKTAPEIKAKIEEYKGLRNLQKTQLKAGSHKGFIDLVWTKLHGEGGGAVAVPEENIAAIDASDDDKSITSFSTDFEFNPNDDYLNESLDGRFLESKEIAIETSSSALLSPSDRKLTTNYVFFALLQQIPKQYVIDSKGNLAEKDVDQSGKVPAEPPNETLEEGKEDPMAPTQVDSVIKNPVVKAEGGPALSNAETETRPEPETEQDNTKEPEMFNTLVCKHCKNEDMQAAFLPESAEDLRASFSDVPAHLMSCNKCPQSIKTKLSSLKAFRPIQEALLKRGAQKKLMHSVWNRVNNHFNEPKDKAPELKIPDFIHNSSEVLSKKLMAEDDRALVTEFTFFTFEQMVPCVLDNSGNGSRSMFTFGFPGLGCKHCADKSNARRFFYRTAEILSGNYAHIPNHVLTCVHAPGDVKKTLAALKKIHPVSKQKLSRGSQRTFFERFFSRLHSNKN